MRIVKMQGVNLAQFQFDYDLTWAALFLNSDGTTYARYGARDESGPMALNSLAGLRATLRRVLEIHKGYPQNKSLLRDKRGPKPRFTRAGAFPVREMRDRAKKGSKHKDCIHCHMVHEAQFRVAVDEGRYDPKNYFRYPPPDSIGLALDKDAATKIVAVRKGSIAAEAGLQPGDEILVLDGQVLASIADLVWVLHHAGERGDLKGQVWRKGQRQPFTLELTKGWRPTNLGWRASMFRMPPWPRVWLVELPDGQRESLKIPDHRLALLVKLVWGPHLTRAGIRKNDVIVGYDGRRKRCTAGQFHAHLRLTCYRPKSKLKLKILRRGREQDILVEF